LEAGVLGRCCRVFGNMADEGEAVTLRQISRSRVLHEMLRSVKGGAADWKVLITDEVTVKVLSACVKMTDIQDEGISVVEDLNKRRQPLTLDAIYFIQPTRNSVKRLIEDLSGKAPLYPRAWVFFSSPLPRDLLSGIRADAGLVARLGKLAEFNLEYLAVDQHAFVTDHPAALEHLFGEPTDGGAQYKATIESIAARLATLFGGLKEFPAIRYRKARAEGGAVSGRDLVPTQLASALWDRIFRLKQSLPGFPAAETCDLLIVDRSVDPIAPVIHEWTYDAMLHDLIDLQDHNTFKYDVVTNAGKTESRTAVIDDHDMLWQELRNLHIAEANLRLNDKMQQFNSMNKAAQVRKGGRPGDVQFKDMRSIVQNLQSGYRDQLAKLNLHVEIATKLNNRISAEKLSAIGNLEQDLVFGDATSKELIALINGNPEITSEDKVRLLMIYAATHPEKLDATKRMQWMKLMRLTGADMQCVTNLEYLGVAVSKKSSASAFSLSFGKRKAKRPVRKERVGDDEAWSLSRFTPLVQDLVEEVAEDKLPRDQYVYVKEPATPPQRLAREDTSAQQAKAAARPSARTARTANCAKNAPKEEDSSRPGSATVSASRGRRIVVFIVGGITRSEVRVAHKLTSTLQQEVILGSTSIDSPQVFLQRVKHLSSMDDVDL